MSLPSFNTDDRILSMMQSAWATAINPVIDNPSNKSVLLKNVALINGVTVVNTLLGRTLQGWRIVDINAAANIYRSAPLNALTLTLTSDAAAVVTLEVF